MSQQESECSDDIFTVHTRVREISDSESDGSDVHGRSFSKAHRSLLWFPVKRHGLDFLADVDRRLHAHMRKLVGCFQICWLK